jgi:hypothetical protein
MNMQTATETLKATPPVAVGVTTLWGMPLAEWAQIAAIVWTVFLLIEKAPTVWLRLQEFYRWIKKGIANVRSL